MEKKRIHIISLGCSKNLMDSERLMAMLNNVGYEVNHNPHRVDVKKGDTVVINTCGFIGDAKKESIDEILSWIRPRQKGKIAGLYVMGCLSQRYATELPQEIPEVDAWFGKTDWPDLIKHLGSKFPGSAPYDRIITTPGHYAYLKISEGCNRRCAFCAIPLITGPQRSRSIEELVAETRMLVSRGVKEINVIAQELTSYGIDLYGKREIARLVDELAQVPGVEMLRLHYAYPKDFPLEFLDVMARHENVAKYLDIALQHVSDSVLERMNRHITGTETRELLAEMRRRVPGIHIRTTLMVGFPGETDADFQELMAFVKEQRFERMGAFMYSEEEGTGAADRYPDNVPQAIKQARYDKLMQLQEQTSYEINQNKIGQRLKVIIDRREGENYIGRTQWDSPEVDNEVIIKNLNSHPLKRGDIVDVLITGAWEYDLQGEYNG